MITVVTSRVAIVKSSLASVVYRFRLRALEWEHAIIAFGFGVIVLVNPGLFDAPSFSAFVGGPTIWGCVVLGVGALNIIALIVNGSVPRPTAMARTLSAAAQIFLFLMLAAGFVFSGTWTTGWWTYFVLGIFGFPAAAWALLDAVAPEYHGQ